MEAILHSGVAALSLRSRVSLRFGGVVGYKPFTTMREQENLLSSQLAVFERVAVCVFFATRVWDLYITTFAIAAKAPEHSSEDKVFCSWLFNTTILRLLNRNQWYQVRPRSTTPGLKKSGKTSLCCKLTPNHARNIGFSISHRGPKTHNPRTQVLYVVPHPTQTTVIPGTHALVGVVPSTTSQRNTTPKRAARHMHGLTSSTAPTVGEVEVLVWPPRSTPESRTSYYLRVSE